VAGSLNARKPVYSTRSSWCRLFIVPVVGRVVLRIHFLYWGFYQQFCHAECCRSCTWATVSGWFEFGWCLISSTSLRSCS